MPNRLNESICKRHMEAHNKLKAAAAKWTGNGVTLIYKTIGKRVGCSHITVSNYVNGDYKDGFLTEAITAEFKKLKLKP